MPSPGSHRKEFFLRVLRPYHHSRHHHQRHRRHHHRHRRNHHRHRRHHHPIHKLPTKPAPIYSADSSSGKDSNIQPSSHKISFALAKKNKDRLAKKPFSHSSWRLLHHVIGVEVFHRKGKGTQREWRIENWEEELS